MSIIYKNHCVYLCVCVSVCEEGIRYQNLPKTLNDRNTLITFATGFWVWLRVRVGVASKGVLRSAQCGRLIGWPGGSTVVDSLAQGDICFGLFCAYLFARARKHF